MKRKYSISLPLLVLLIVSVCSCQKEPAELKITYNDSIYSLRTYKVERHPPVVRNGFGMDMYHTGNAGFDTMYLSSALPAWHPNNPHNSGTLLKRFRPELNDSVQFEYDLLFFNEFAYTLNYNGDYNGTGYPVIFMYTDPFDDNKSTKAAMIGQGITCFEKFTADSITDKYVKKLKSDPVINLPSLRTELHTQTINGVVMLTDSVDELYKSLVIGIKFRPNIGGVFNINDASDDAQADLQPVFLVKTREGNFAKFMVTRFKGTGIDTQKLTLRWQALKN